MRKSIGGSLVIAVLAAVSAAGQTPARLDAQLRAQRDSGFSGVVLFARGDTVIFEKAYSQPGARPLTLNSQFNIASMTKGFTAAAILRLRSQHRLSFRDPLSRFFPHAPIDKRDITVFQLLTHTSGLDGHSAGSGIMRREGAVNAILSQRLSRSRARFGDDLGELHRARAAHAGSDVLDDVSR
jgi:CubicO group peptidase (beta-lactamase class C family)